MGFSFIPKKEAREKHERNVFLLLLVSFSVVRAIKYTANNNKSEHDKKNIMMLLRKEEIFAFFSSATGNHIFFQQKKSICGLYEGENS